MNVTSTAYAFRIPGNPTTLAAKAKALAGPGHLLIATDHKVAAFLPEALDTTSKAPDVLVRTADIDGALIAGALLSPALIESGVHFTLDNVRSAKFIKDIHEAAFDWTPIPGEAKTAWPVAYDRLSTAVKALTPAQRTIELADVIYDGAADDAGTGKWYDHMSPKLLMAGDGGTDTVAQWIALVPEAIFKGAAGGRGGDTFKEAIEQIEASVGRDISELGGSAQAAAVAVWINRTKAPTGMIPYVDNPSIEIERRAQPTPEARFEPLWAVLWRPANTPLAKLWPQQVDDVVISTTALATGLGLASTGSGLTPQIALSIKRALPGWRCYWRQ